MSATPTDRPDGSFVVAIGIEPARTFTEPMEVLRAFSPEQAAAALQRADEYLRDGAWIAGCLSYELGAALLPGSGRKDSPLPLVSLGAFERPPDETPLPQGAFAMSGLLPAVTRDRYDTVIAALQDEIRDGNVYQANYTVPFHVQMSGDPLALYAYYARRTGAGYQAFVLDGDRAICSWSPELFLSIDGAAVFTKPMKGTAAPGYEHELDDAKNRAEHVMIVDLLRNDLHRVCDRVDAENLFNVERYPTFSTMTSTIAGTLRASVTLLELMKATFPCGSVTGAPKRAAMAFLRQFESLPRGAYCGSIGFLSPQRRGWWNVAIRTAQFDVATGHGRFDAGGGIVADSSATAEWSEILLKSQFLHDGAGAFALLETFASDADPATLQRHAARLKTTAQAFGIAFDRAAFDRAVSLALDDAGATGLSEPRIVRVRLMRDGSYTAAVEACERSGGAVRVCLAPQRVRSGDPFLRYKTSWRTAYDGAAATAAQLRCFDALLRNERDEFTEGTRTNLFVDCGDGILWTPPLDAGLLPGILRERLVSEGRARERSISLGDLRAARALFIGNSARGMLPARIVE